MLIKWTDKNGKEHLVEHDFWLAYGPDSDVMLTEQIDLAGEIAARAVKRPARVTLTGLVLRETARVYGLGEGGP